MTKLESDTLGIVPLSKEYVEKLYVDRAFPEMRCLMRSHERLRMEVEGAMALIEEDRVTIEELKLKVKMLDGE